MGQEVAPGKKFSSDYQPKKNGRKKSHLKKWMKDDGVGTTDIRLLLSGILTRPRTIEALKAMLLNPKTPPAIKFPVKCLISDYGKNKLDTYKWLIEYGYGVPKQEVENTNINKVTSLSKEDRDALRDELIKKLGEKEYDSE